MPLEGCDVLLGMPWIYRVHGVLDTFNKTVTLEHRGKTHVLNVKLKGELPPERPEDHAIDLISGVAHL